MCPSCLVAGGLSAAEIPSLPKSESDSKATLHIVIPEDSALPPSAPRRLGKYELLEEIARGGMGIVYKARHTGLDSIVAVKLIRSGVLATPTDVERFQREARSAARLQHPNIVTIHDIGEQDGQHYFSMDYVPGANLAELARTRPFSPKQAAEITARVALAIHYAHQQGVLHRDVKPANVILTPEQQPRVLDFGLARIVADDSQLTQSGAPMGSPCYMPPEQAGGKRESVGAWSDVYSLGALLYELLTGRPPFQAPTAVETLRLVLESDPVLPRLFDRTLPSDLETICLKCLEKEPAKRYATAQELADELGRFIDDKPIQARRVTQAERVWRWCRRKPALASAIGLATALLLVVSIGSPLVALNIDRARQKTALNLYAADIKGASVALEEHDLLGARKLLNQIASSPYQRDLRGWEWRYLMDQCRSDELATLRGHGAWVEGVAFSPDDKVLTSISGDGVVKLWDWRLRKESLSWRAHAPVLKHRPTSAAHAVMFLPHTSILATTGADAFVHLW
ncbi:MAG: protein kinase, partial [Verrucomicrobia bacterium]|nr:protein kinase [Verrucomicrobiota bacterium]